MTTTTEEKKLEHSTSRTANPDPTPAVAAIVQPPLVDDPPPLPRRAVAAALGALGLFALSGCAAPTGRTDGSLRKEQTSRTKQALLTGATTTESIAELRSAGVGSDQAVFVQGYYAPGDGGEGHFWCNTADTTSADDGGTIIVDILDQRWYRLTYDTTLSVKWFGATGDGATDDTVAIQAAISAAQAISGGGAVRFPPGAYCTTDTLYVTAPVTLVGSIEQPNAAKILPSSRAYDVINVTEVYYGFYMRGLTLGPPVSATDTGGHGIKLIRNQVVDIEFVNIYDTYNGILNDSSGSVYFRRVIILPAEMSGLHTGRYGLKVSGLSYINWLGNNSLPPGNPNSTECHNVLIREGGTGKHVDGFVFCEKYQSLTLHDSGAFGCNRRLWMTDLGSGHPPAFLVEESGTSDGNAHGWVIDSAEPECVIQLTNCLCTSSAGDNFFVGTGCQGSIQFNGCRVAKSGGYVNNGEGAGFRLAGSGNYVLLGCVADTTGGHNVLVTAYSTAHISIIGGTFSWPGNHGHPSSVNRNAFHIDATAGGTLSLAGVNQHNAAKGMYDAGSTCLIHGHALFTINSITGIDISANLKTPGPPPHASSPPYSNVWYP